MAKPLSFNWNSFVRNVLSIGAIGLATGGCSVYDASLVRERDGGSVVPTTCMAGSTGCIPAKPPANTSTPADSNDMSFALRDVLLEQYTEGLPPMSQPWRSIGFDLDGIATDTNTSPNGCKTPTEPDGGGPTQYFPIDGLEGIDNQFGAQLSSALLPIVAPELQNNLCCMQHRGRGTLLLRVRDWNGMDEDASVRISLTSSMDGTAADPALLTWEQGTERGPITTTGGVPAAIPSWTADTDTWYTNATDVSSNNIDDPRHVDLDGYVSGGYLVMALDPTQPIKLYLGHENGISIGLRLGTLIAHISPNRHLIDAGWIGGRMGSAELLDASYRLQANTLYSSAALGVPPNDPNDNVSGCSTTAMLIAPLLDSLGDLLTNGQNNPDLPCNALSAGVSFRGVRAKSVVVAPASLSIPLPDCDFQTPILGTVTPDEGNCPFNGTAPCALPSWNPGG
jgi:hypothetical protein